MKIVRICLLIFSLSLLTSTGIHEAKAQNIGIRISPVRVEEVVDPGEVLTEAIKVTNNSSTAKTFYAYLRDFKAEGELGTPKLIRPGTEEGYYLASWIDITDQGIEFAPFEEKVLPYTIIVPSNIGPGGYYGAVLFGTEPPKLFQDAEDKGAGMAVSQQTASLILLRVKGDIKEEASIREFNTNKEVYNTPFKVEFLIRIENSGNVHVSPYGDIVILNMFNKEVAKIRVNDKGGNILPKSIRRFTVDWEDSGGFGKYRAKLGMTYGISTASGGQGQQTLYTEKTFWIIPWRIVIPASIGLIIFLALLILFLRFYKSKAVRRALEQMGIGQVRYIRRQQGPSPALHFSLILASLLIIALLIGVVTYFIFFA